MVWGIHPKRDCVERSHGVSQIMQEDINKLLARGRAAFWKMNCLAVHPARLESVFCNFRQAERYLFSLWQSLSAMRGRRRTSMLSSRSAILIVFARGLPAERRTNWL